MTRPESLQFLEKALTQSIGPLRMQRHFLLSLILAVFAERRISLPWLAQALNATLRPASNQMRIQRFLANFHIRPAHFAPIIASFLPNEPWILAIDRTNWYWEKQQVNFLILAVVVNGSAIPLFWKALDHEGNSHTRERIQLMQEFLRTFGVHHIDSLQVPYLGACPVHRFERLRLFQEPQFRIVGSQADHLSGDTPLLAAG